MSHGQNPYIQPSSSLRRTLHHSLIWSFDHGSYDFYKTQASRPQKLCLPAAARAAQGGAGGEGEALADAPARRLLGDM